MHVSVNQLAMLHAVLTFKQMNYVQPAEFHC